MRSFGFLSLVSAIYPCHYRSADIVPYAEYGARDSGERVGGEMKGGERTGEAGVLHADFDGEGDGFLPGEAAELGYGKT